MHQRTSSDPAVVVPVVIRKKRMVWNIFGAAYDLTPFLDVHPGGRRILETCAGELDWCVMLFVAVRGEDSGIACRGERGLVRRWSSILSRPPSRVGAQQCCEERARRDFQ